MRFSLLFGAVLLALSSVPVYAQKCDTVDGIRQMASDLGGEFQLIENDLLDEFAVAMKTAIPEGAQRAVIVAGAGGTAYGFEMSDGCLTGPVYISRNPVSVKPTIQS